MSRYDEPTQRVRSAPPPTAPLPGSLDPLRRHRPEQPAQAEPAEPALTEPEFVETGTGWVETPEPEPAAADATGVLPLDEIFAGPAEAARDRMPTAAADAPTWTAMPVVPVRSGPVPAGPTDSLRIPPYDGPGDTDRREILAVTWAETRMRLEAWIRRDDNGLMLLTAVVACVLMIVVAGVGR